ncbi:hypothetical protein [Pseudobutyrivibrio ruminis]|uniref:hypothetical protein n=1 Tax=Pseudobutyrivibrio ruminis TaxID=46206 RepID=UPI00051B9293|nr:hypothetical protein [Pseudobutyrivibrio ruminis]
MSQLINEIRRSVFSDKFSNEQMKRRIEDITTISEFFKKLDTGGEVELMMPSYLVSENNAKTIRYDTLEYIITSYSKLIEDCTLLKVKEIQARRQGHPHEEFWIPEIEDVVSLFLIDNAAANMVKKYNNYHSFLKDLNCELFELLDKKMGRNKNHTNHNEQLALILRLSWEMSYIKKVADSVKECEYSSDSSSTEKRYKDREKKKIIKEFKASGVQGEWIKDISLLAAHTDSNGLCHEAMMIVNQVQVKYKWLFDCIESSSY